MSRDLSRWVADADSLLELQRATPNVVSDMPSDVLIKLLTFRVEFLDEELSETRRAMSERDGDGLVDGLIDLCVIAIGTLRMFGVDADEAWRRVHAANMAKEVGVNPRRANPFGLPDLIKPTGWAAPSHADNAGFFQRVLEGGSR